MILRRRAAVLNAHTSEKAEKPMASRTLALPDGSELAYRVAGEGPTVLLVHGWGASGLFFDALAGHLAHDFHVIVPDLRGHGRSPVGETPATIDLLAADLKHLLDALAIDRPLALGWSMGAMVLWRMIETYSADMLCGLITEDMSPRIVNDDDWVMGMATGLDAETSARAVTAMRENWPAYAQAFASKMFARDRAKRDPALVDATIERLTDGDADAMAQLWASMARQDLRAALPAMHLPVLVTYGERSQAYSVETSQYLAETLPDARLQGFARSGHSPHLEEPEAFADAVSCFAHRVTAAPAHQSIEGSIS
jgi:pimeloyl-ACP methyl ester carboxylesterase